MSSSVTDARSRTAGFTVVELLVGMAILGLLLAMLGSLFLSSVRAYDTNREITAGAAQLRSAIEFLEYDVSLAGYAGLSPDSEPVSVPLTVTDCESTACNPDGLQGRLLGSLTVRYVEDRYVPGGGAAHSEVTYSVEDGHLYRCNTATGACGAGKPGNKLAEGITGLELRSYRTASGGPAAELPSVVTGLDLRLHYRRSGKAASEDVSIALLNRMETR